MKKAINIYFNGDYNKAIEARERWSYLLTDFVRNSPDFGHADGIAFSGTYHNKQEHTNLRETTLIHLHDHFLIEVTPKIFSAYLKALFTAQKKHNKNYQFIQDYQEVTFLIQTFSEYYKNYKNSSFESEYEQDTALTEDEKREHQQQLYQEKIKHLIPPFFLNRIGHIFFNDPASKKIETINHKEIEPSGQQEICTLF